MRILIIILFSTLLGAGASTAQRVLHFTRTSGYDHQTRGVSHAMFQSIAAELGMQVDDDSDAGTFSDPAVLAQYDAIVFSNTSGNAILNAQQRANFEAWVANGGHVLGIHAASDTYRHSTANGGNTGTWDFYAELLGGSVQENPNHVDGTPTYTMQRVGAHPSTYGIPDQWEKAEEYYYWEGGYFAEFNTGVLIVEETVGPNGQVNSYDAPRPMSWYRSLPSGTRVFYTALGHAPDNFTSDPLFRTHIRDALAWLMEGTTGIGERQGTGSITVFPNPAKDVLHLIVDRTLIGQPITLHDMMGRVVLERRVEGERTVLPVNTLATGSYMLRIGEQATAIRIDR